MAVTACPRERATRVVVRCAGSPSENRISHPSCTGHGQESRRRLGALQKASSYLHAHFSFCFTEEFGLLPAPVPLLDYSVAGIVEASLMESRELAQAERLGHKCLPTGVVPVPAIASQLNGNIHHVITLRATLCPSVPAVATFCWGSASLALKPSHASMTTRSGLGAARQVYTGSRTPFLRTQAEFSSTSSSVRSPRCIAWQ